MRTNELIDIAMEQIRIKKKYEYLSNMKSSVYDDKPILLDMLSSTLSNVKDGLPIEDSLVNQENQQKTKSIIKPIYSNELLFANEEIEEYKPIVVTLNK